MGILKTTPECFVIMDKIFKNTESLNPCKTGESYYIIFSLMWSWNDDKDDECDDDHDDDFNDDVNDDDVNYYVYDYFIDDYGDGNDDDNDDKWKYNMSYS